MYNPAAAAITINVKMLGGTGWSLVAPSTAGSIPSGYSNKEASLTDGTIYSEKFSGNGSGLSSLNGSNISSGTVAKARLGAHSHAYTPAGSVSSSFTGTAHNHSFTGTKHKHTFTGSAVTSGGPSGTDTIYQITGVGSLPSCTLPTCTLPTVSVSYSSGELSITHTAGSFTAGSFSAGSLPTRASVTMPKSDHTHSVTAAGTLDEIAATGTIGDKTAGGSVSSSFTGTASTASTIS